MSYHSEGVVEARFDENTCRKPKYATASFMSEMKRLNGVIPASVTYSSVRLTRSSRSPRGAIEC